MTNQTKGNQEEEAGDRQKALVERLEEALPGAALRRLDSAEARYAAAVHATTAPVTVTTTSTT
jgi:hypothetical protein